MIVEWNNFDVISLLVMYFFKNSLLKFITPKPNYVCNIHKTYGSKPTFENATWIAPFSRL